MPSSATDRPSTDKPTTRRRRALLLAVVAVVVLLIDLGSKIWAVAALDPREPVRLAGGLLYLTLARNTGAAFSLGTDFTVIITIVMITVIAGILLLARKVASTTWAWALGLVLGGAGGNLVDRLFRHPSPFRGAVIDFFSVLDPYGGFFPIFNVADIGIVCGGILAALLALTGRELDGSRTGHAKSPGSAADRSRTSVPGRTDDSPAERSET